MPLFDRHVAVDWSAATTRTTGRDSIWVADVVATAGERGDDRRGVTLHNPATRTAARDLLVRLLDDAAGDRVLVGIDVGLGYPAGSAGLFGIVGVPWRSMWAEIAQRSRDDDRNRNNRFEVAAALNACAGPDEGPFWGCPSDSFGSVLRRTKPIASAVGEYREVERRLKAAGRHPKSCWQLLGAGSVGGQTLTAIPILDRLLDRGPWRVDVWPFTTGLRVPPTVAVDAGRPKVVGGAAGGVVVAEVWPSLFVDEVPIGEVPDAVQVRATATALRDADSAGALDDWFAPAADDVAAVETEEGWILGPPAMMEPT